MEKIKEIFGNLNNFFTALTTLITLAIAIQTTLLTNKVNNLKSVSEEGEMFVKLVEKFSNEKVDDKKSDFLFLSIERYLRNTNDGCLKEQDKKMLVGFAKAIILERVYSKDSITSSTSIINTAKKFLKENDPPSLKEIDSVSENVSKTVTLPNSVIKKSDSLYRFSPISKLKNTQAESLSLIVKPKKTIYIQYSNDSKKSKINAIKDLLNSKSWITPGIENVKGEYKNTIRYFHDEDRTLANESNELLGNKYKLLRVYNFESKVPKGQIEIWINNN